MPYGSGGYAGSVYTQRQQYAAQQAAWASMSPEQQQALLAQISGANAFASPQKEPEESFFGKLVPNVVEKAVGQIADVAINAIPGAFYTAKDIGSDALHGEFSPVNIYWDLAHGRNPFPKRSSRIVEAMGRQTYEDFRHPLRNPGYLAIDIASLATLGSGAAARTAAAGRAVRAGRAARMGDVPPPDLGPPTRAPRPSPTPPGPGDADFVARDLPSRSISDVVAAPARQPNAPTPLVKNYPYKVTDASGNSLEAYYLRDTTVRGRQLHLFADAYGKPKVIAPERIQNLDLLVPQITGKSGDIIAGKRITLDPGEHLRLDALPEAPPPQFRVRTTRAAAAAGETRVAGRFAEKVEEARPPASVQAVETQLKKEAEKPGPSLRQQAEERQMIEPKFEPIPGERNAVAANVGEGERVILRQRPDGQYLVTHMKGVEVVDEVVKPNITAAAREAKGRAKGIINRPKGGEIPSFAQAYIRGPLRELTTKPPAKLRQIESFRERPPVYARQGEKLDPAEVERLQNLAARYPPEKRTFETKAAAGAEETLGVEAFPETAPLPLNVVERKLPRTGWRGQKEGETVLSTGAITKADVILSRSPAASLATNIWIDVLEKFPELKVGPWGRDMRAYVKFNKREERMAHQALVAAREAGIDREARQLDQALDQVVRGASRESLLAAIDSANMLAKIWLLYLKPAYYGANIIGQTLISAADHAWSPRSMAHSVRMQWNLYKDRDMAGYYATAIKKSMQESGVAMNQAESGLGYMRKVRSKIPGGWKFRGKEHRVGELLTYEKYAGLANKLLDTPFRDNAFFTEARRYGYDTAPKIKKLIDDAIAGDEAAIQQFTTISRRANRNIIDYARLGPQEKRWVRRLFFFYPWFKGASIYSGRFVAEHPLQAYIANNLGIQGTEENRRLLGPIPSFAKGIFKVGERDVPGLGKQPLVVNPQAVTVFGTPGQVLNTAMGALAGSGDASSQLSQYFTPAISAGVAAATKQDPFTGREYPARMGALDIVADQLKQTIAPTRALDQWKRAKEIEAGKIDPSEVLFPYTGTEVLGRYVLGPYPYAMNTREARSRAFAEQTSLATRRQREQLKNKDYHDRYLEAGKETRLFGAMPPELTDAFKQRALLYSETAAFEAQLDRPMTMIDRLQATLGVLVRQGQMDGGQARQILVQMAQLPDSTIESYKSKLTAAYFGGEVISRYRAALNASGANLTVP